MVLFIVTVQTVIVSQSRVKVYRIIDENMYLTVHLEIIGFDCCSVKQGICLKHTQMYFKRFAWTFLLSHLSFLFYYT